MVEAKSVQINDRRRYRGKEKIEEMAESAVCLVIDKLVSLLVEEAKLLKGVRREVAEIKDELESIKSFLKDADARAANEGDTSEGVKIWVKQVREIAHKIEDMVDEYMPRMAQHPHRRGFKGFLYKVSRLIGKVKMSHELASEIQDIKRSVGEVKERSVRYEFNSSRQGASSSGNVNTSLHDPCVSSLFIEEAEIVGIESPRDQLVSLLVDEESKRTIVSVVGMGGLGKTTLARKVYDHQKVTDRIDCRAWITVSQSYRMDEVLQSIMKQFCEERRESAPEGIHMMKRTQLIEKLREYLEQKRYVVVFDDVWEIDLWRTIKHALFDNDKGSRIIITTRVDDVASSCKESPFDHVHYLQPLAPERAWELFCNKAFQSDFGGRCLPELEQLSLEIVTRCGGLPLAIVAIGGLLKTKSKDVFQWQKLLNSLGSELESNAHLKDVTRILSLSYHELPHYLKSCFLYFGIFPEDYSIRCTRLIRLWIAEDFVQEKQGLTLEQVAEDYLTELIHRSLVQVSWVDFDGKARSCRVHDLLREIILSKSKELTFCQVVANKDSGFNRETKSRRLSIHNSTNNDLENIGNSPLRSIFLFERDKLPKSLMSMSFANFKLLKVLDFEGASLDFVHEEVGNLFHLRYLSMRSTRVKKLPKSIGKLHNLQTLDLKHSLVHELPIGINLLHKLRHLLAYSYNFNSIYTFESVQGVKIHEGVRCLEALQKLCYVDANQENSLIAELMKLRELRKLGIVKLRKEHGRVLCELIEKMNHLYSLTLMSASEDEILDIHHILHPPKFLGRIFLQGRLGKVPNWIAQLQHLVKLSFCWTGLTEDPLKLFQALPSLLKFQLIGGYASDQLYLEEGGFQKLKVLHLRELDGLKNLIIDKGALPLLGELFIGPCPLLEKVPFGIQHLRKLTTLHFIDMPPEFLLQLDPDKGELYWVVEHIPAIFLKHERERRGFDTHTLRQSGDSNIYPFF